MFENLDADILARAEQIKLVVFDIDGVLTDGSLTLGDENGEYRTFYSRDGLGLIMLKRTGVVIAVISGQSSRAVTERMNQLGIEHIYQDQQDKGKTLDMLVDKLDIKAGNVAYVGDDFIDLPAMQHVGLAMSVADAHPLVIEKSHWVSKAKGGRGAVREICELIMYSQGKLDAQIKYFLND